MLGLCNAQLTLSPLAPAQDADAGLDPAACYPVATASGVWCVAQQIGEDREEADGRVGRLRDWRLAFPAETTPAAVLDAKVNDRVVVTMADDRTHTLLVSDTADMGGRGVMFEMTAVERL